MKNEEEVTAKLGRLIANTQTGEQLQKVRATLLDRYFAEKYGDEVEKKSEFVSSDCSDVVEAMMPDLMDLFTGSEHIAEFNPVGPEDEDATKQETDVCHHIFWELNPGFMIAFNWIKEALIAQNSYVKQGWVKKRRVTIEDYEDLTMDELRSIFGDMGDVEYELISNSGFSIEDTEQGPMIMPEVDEMGQPKPIAIKVRCIKNEKEYEIENVPQECIFMTSDWHKVSLNGIPVVGHWKDVEVGELRAMGFHEESLEKMDDEGDEEQYTSRHDTEDNPIGMDPEEGDEATRMVRVYEAYCRADINDDGMAELVKVFAYGDGSKLMKWADGNWAIEEVSDHPFCALTPIPIPHRHNGRGIVEFITDIARTKTVLWRSTLDAIYATLYPRPYFDGSKPGAQDLVDSLALPDHGAPIDTNGIEVLWTTPPQIIDTTLPMLQALDQTMEKRTGVTAYNQGLDTESLNKTLGGMQEIRDMSNMKKMLIARVMAETGFKDLFVKIHKDLRSGPHKKLVMKLRNRWIETNPREWRQRSDMTVTVGTGTGDRDQIREGMLYLGAEQDKFVQMGLPHVGPDEKRATIAKVMSTYGVEDVSPFIVENPPEPPPPPPPPPDPMLISAQAQMAKVEADAAADQAQAQIKQMEIQMKQELDRQKLEFDHQIKMLEMQIKNKTATEDIQTDDETLEIKKAELALKDREIRIKEVEANIRTDKNGVKINPIDGLMDEIKNGNAVLAEQLRQSQETTTAAMVAALTAPKQIVTDENGRPVGVKTV